MASRDIEISRNAARAQASRYDLPVAYEARSCVAPPEDQTHPVDPAAYDGLPATTVFCACKKVKLEIRGEHIFSGFCHCSLCR